MTMMSDLFDKLAAEEDQFFSSRFLSPVLKGQPIRVRIAGITLTLKVTPKNFEGWGIFVCRDQKRARRVSEPTMAQKREYLKLYPRFSFVVCQRGDEGVRGLIANRSDTRVTIQGHVPLLLPEEVQLLDTVDARFDGQNFWFEGQSSHRSPRIAQQLRDFLSEEVEPDKIELLGMTQEEGLAYQIAHIQEIESKKDRKEERIKDALQRGGAVLRSYVERGDTYTVEFTVDGERHRSVVNSETLRVQSAGICLTNHRTGRVGDSDFDLQSLVGVIREGHQRHLIYRVGAGGW
jgi:hypothetical protein